MSMSEEEIRTAKGRMVENYLQARSRFEALQSEAAHVAGELEKIAGSLKSGGDPSRAYVTGGNIQDLLSKKAATLLEDLTESRRLRDDLRQSLVNMGLDLRAL